ncbi:hypothetical protein ACQCWA_20735 [Rossellomorea aquimaris]|jgi:hypothetical protein|nr:hypothetical protein [Bacillus sp. CH30_1T]
MIVTVIKKITIIVIADALRSMNTIVAAIKRNITISVIVIDANTITN